MAFSNVAAFIGGTGIHLRVVWNAHITPSCLGDACEIKNIYVFMR